MISISLRYSYSSEDMAFADSHAAWVQHTSGMFSQIDLRDCTKPIDAISRVAVSWEASGTLAFVADRPASYEMPYDDMYVSLFSHVNVGSNRSHATQVGSPLKNDYRCRKLWETHLPCLYLIFGKTCADLDNHHVLFRLYLNDGFALSRAGGQIQRIY